MKKELKNYTALNSRIILVTIFILFIVNRTYAQCSTACQENIDIDNNCITGTCYGLDNTYINGIPPYNTLRSAITINDTNFSVDVNMTVTDITIKDDMGGGVGGTFNTASDFNSSPYSTATSIKFNNGSQISINGIPTSTFIGYAFYFTVNVVKSSDGTPLASRSYYFKIKSAGYITGDTHITTVDGVRYDFQTVGEFVTLLGDNLEIQTRQTAVATSGPATDSYSGLSTCVSVNTAVAARVGKHRVTYQPNISGQPDPDGLQLRVDGKLTELGDNGLDLGSGGHVKKSPAGGGAILIDFPDGATLAVTPGWWAPFNQWYLNVAVNNTSATKGISGTIANKNDTARGISFPSKSWLPALPDGSSVGAMPTNLHDRFITLYQKFADAWRVTDKTSLFDYAPGTSTASFTNKNWPTEYAQSCSVADQNPNAPIDRAAAEKLAINIVDPKLKPNAIFDIMVTGEPTFARTYLLTQQIQNSTTAIGVSAGKDKTNYGEPVTFTAIVYRKFSAVKDILTGSVEFNADGMKIGQVILEANGHAILTTSTLEVGRHQISAKFIPDPGTMAFSSRSPGITHTVLGTPRCRIFLSGMYHRFDFDTKLPINDGNGFNLRLGVNVHPKWGVEAEWGLTQTNDSANVDGKVHNLNLNGLYYLGTKPIVPYVTAGVGTLNFKGFTKSDKTFALNGGVGIIGTIPNMPVFAYRVEIKAHYGLDGYSTNENINMQYSLGLTYRIKTKPTP